jgi:hypothetical protein
MGQPGCKNMPLELILALFPMLGFLAFPWFIVWAACLPARPLQINALTLGEYWGTLALREYSRNPRLGGRLGIALEGSLHREIFGGGNPRLWRNIEGILALGED